VGLGWEKLHATNAGKKGNGNGKTQTRLSICVRLVGWMVGKGEGESKGKPLTEKANVQCVCKKRVVMVIVCLPYSFSPLSLTHSKPRLTHSQLQSANVK